LAAAPRAARRPSGRSRDRASRRRRGPIRRPCRARRRAPLRRAAPRGSRKNSRRRRCGRDPAGATTTRATAPIPPPPCHTTLPPPRHGTEPSRHVLAETAPRWTEHLHLQLDVATHERAKAVAAQARFLGDRLVGGIECLLDLGFGLVATRLAVQRKHAVEPVP